MDFLIVFAMLLVALPTSGSGFEVIPFFRAENAQIYTSFAQSNPQLTQEQVVLYVNIGLHNPFYENVSYVDDPTYIRVLVNKFFRLPQGYSPPGLIQVAPDHYMRDQAAAAFFEMRAELEQAGYELVVRSAYRSYDLQAQIYSNNVATMGQDWADMWSARPGHSEHQTGLALDVLQPGMADVSLGNANFQNTPQYAWLGQNAHRFGFILSYPLGYTHITGYEYEPWHWRYIGVTTATYMFDNNIPTLEHYFASRFDPQLLAAPLDTYYNDYDQATEQATTDQSANELYNEEESGTSIFIIILTIIGVIFGLLAAFVIAVFVMAHIRRKKKRAARKSRRLRSGMGYTEPPKRSNRQRGSGRYR